MLWLHDQRHLIDEMRKQTLYREEIRTTKQPLNTHIHKHILAIT